MHRVLSGISAGSKANQSRMSLFILKSLPSARLLCQSLMIRRMISWGVSTPNPQDPTARHQFIPPIS